MSTLLSASLVESANLVPVVGMRHLGLIESLLASVLQQEGGQHLVDLLRQLQSVCLLEGKAQSVASAEAAALVEKLDLNAAIRATRAFALYFQLIMYVSQISLPNSCCNRATICTVATVSWVASDSGNRAGIKGRRVCNSPNNQAHRSASPNSR